MPSDQFIARAFNTEGVSASQLAMPYVRRSTYKISLYTGGTAQVQYAGQTMAIERATLLFFNPLLPYSCEQQQGLTGYFCEFSDDFFYGTERSASLQESPLFRLGANPLFHLAEEQLLFLSQLFKQLAAQATADYRHQQEVLRAYVQVVVNTALQLQPPMAVATSSNAAQRLATSFLQLLEQQFPVVSPTQPVALHTPQDFAERLHVHVNHLNRAVREVTGKTTSAHLAERLAREAQALLRHTTWTVAEIARCLGFAEALYFTRFFRKHLAISPLAYRQQFST